MTRFEKVVLLLSITILVALYLTGCKSSPNAAKFFGNEPVESTFIFEVYQGKDINNTSPTLKIDMTTKMLPYQLGETTKKASVVLIDDKISSASALSEFKKENATNLFKNIASGIIGFIGGAKTGGI